MACTTYLQSFSTSCGSNLASIKKIWVGGFESATFTFNYQQKPNPEYDPENPGTTPPTIDVKDADNKKIIESVTGAVLNTDEWVEFQFKKNTGEMTTEMSRSDNGSYYFTNAANLVFAKQDQVKRLALTATAAGECTIIVQDSNDIYWLIGYSSPVTASTLTATTGIAVGDANQYSLTLSAEEAYMPIPLYTGTEQSPVDPMTIINTLTGTASSN